MSTRANTYVESRRPFARKSRSTKTIHSIQSGQSRARVRRLPRNSGRVGAKAAVVIDRAAEVRTTRRLGLTIIGRVEIRFRVVNRVVRTRARIVRIVDVPQAARIGISQVEATISAQKEATIVTLEEAIVAAIKIAAIRLRNSVFVNRNQDLGENPEYRRRFLFFFRNSAITPSLPVQFGVWRRCSEMHRLYFFVAVVNIITSRFNYCTEC